MININTKRNFYDLFKTDRPVLKVKFDVNSDELATEIEIENKLEKQTDLKGLATLEKICSDGRLKNFLDFYTEYNGFSIGTAVSPKNSLKKPLLRQLQISELTKFTELYLPNGKLAWTIDLNKSKAIYRSDSKWLVFAEVDSGPACLTIFMDGENAGNVFLLNPQPRFNTLKPIAKSYNQLLERIAKDPAAFFKLIRAYVTIVGNDEQNYGHVPIEYIDYR
ncbi:MAG: hypothetical protein KF775_07065 [Cyclobacteriaceae bacterium]|nr:hypothetical protein [Cyclobacteriaceae bacterium]